MWYFHNCICPRSHVSVDLLAQTNFGRIFSEVHTGFTKPIMLQRIPQTKAHIVMGSTFYVPCCKLFNSPAYFRAHRTGEMSTLCYQADPLLFFISLFFIRKKN